jgi:hypothetical protein
VSPNRPCPHAPHAPLHISLPIPPKCPPSVERIVHQLEAVQTILLYLDDLATTQAEIDQPVAFVNYLLMPLEEFLAVPPLAANTNIPHEHTSSRGRPSYILDLQCAHELHALENTWEDIARAMGVTSQTLYNHMATSGISTSRREFTEISDEDLYELVAEISLKHPFVGSTIVHGHLEAQQVHVPRLRVQESLRRVDAIGVLVRSVYRVYHVRGANTLWHIDGNEKLQPWGFWVHGCINGHS